jgi:hypothetical protein
MNIPTPRPSQVKEIEVFKGLAKLYQMINSQTHHGRMTKYVDAFISE